MPAKIDKKRAAALQSYYDTLAGFAQQYALHEDEEYIVRLVGQVVRVSVETVAIVKALPEAFA